MIHLPQRSVTRFFIPLIDVLTLLFCIFLLMPIMKSDNPEEDDADRQARELHLRRLERENEDLRKHGGQLSKDQLDELIALRNASSKALQDRLVVRVLEIDPETGKLSYRDPDRIEVADQADARTLIERDRRERGGGGRQLYYLVLYPRDPGSPYPTRKQRETYDRWFEGVALGYDDPGKGPGQR